MGHSEKNLTSNKHTSTFMSCACMCVNIIKLANMCAFCVRFLRFAITYYDIITEIRVLSVARIRIMYFLYIVRECIIFHRGRIYLCICDFPFFGCVSVHVCVHVFFFLALWLLFPRPNIHFYRTNTHTHTHAKMNPRKEREDCIIFFLLRARFIPYTTFPLPLSIPPSSFDTKQAKKSFYMSARLHNNTNDNDYVCENYVCRPHAHTLQPFVYIIATKKKLGLYISISICGVCACARVGFFKCKKCK